MKPVEISEREKKTRQIATKKANVVMNRCFFIVLILGLFRFPIPTSGCRSSIDSEREPILSHHGTEPPEPTHKKPDTESKPASNEPAVKHEDGEFEVRPNVWEFPVAQTKKGKGNLFISEWC